MWISRKYNIVNIWYTTILSNCYIKRHFTFFLPPQAIIMILWIYSYDFYFKESISRNLWFRTCLCYFKLYLCLMVFQKDCRNWPSYQLQVECPTPSTLSSTEYYHSSMRHQLYSMCIECFTISLFPLFISFIAPWLWKWKWSHSVVSDSLWL